MKIEIVEGNKALLLMEEERFEKEWCWLYEACPWSTGFQSHPFVSTWYINYLEDYLPVILYSFSGDGELAGLLPMAVSRDGKKISVAGGDQAEYQVWLSSPSEQAAFVTGALSMIRGRFPGRGLVFCYLPPSLPLDWLRTSAPVRNHLWLEPRVRPVISLADAGTFQARLEKRKNRYQLRQLAKKGELRFERVADLNRFPVLFDSIIDFYDLRQGAVNDVLPFRCDRLKKPFHLALMKDTDLLDTTVLMAGEHVVSAHLNLCSKEMVHLGIIAHSPFDAKNSPGKFHILMLAGMLSDRGCKVLDLTPGDDGYKKRFANGGQPVHILNVYPDRFRRLLDTAAPRIKAVTRKMLGVFRINPRVVTGFLERVLQEGGHGASFSLAALVRRSLYRMSEWSVHAIDVSAGEPCAGPPALKKDCISDLLEYDEVNCRKTRKEFLFKSLKRIEQEQHFYTLVEEGRLVFCAWLVCGKRTFQMDGRRRGFDLPLDSAVLHDLHLDPEVDSGQRYRALLAQALGEISKEHNVSRVYLVSSGRGRAVCRAAEEIGFRLEYRSCERICLGRFRRLFERGTLPVKIPSP